MQSDCDPVESATKGAVKAGIEWSEEKILQVYQDFKNKKLAFIEDRETIDRIQKQRRKGEWEHFKTYTPYDEEIYILFQTGLTLRELEETEDRKKIDDIIKKIHKRYKTKGIHIAWFAQNGLFSKYVTNILETGATTQQTRDEVKILFGNIDNKVAFISYKSKPKQKVGEIIAKIRVNSPETFIISSVGGAMKACEKIKDEVMQQLSSQYFCEYYESEQKGKKIYFLNRIAEDIT